MTLPVPEALKRANKPRSVADDDSLAVRPVKLTRVDLNPSYYAEYGFKNGNGIAHFFRSGGGSFPASFRSRLFNAFRSWTPSEGVQIDWIDELQSWCVIVKGGAVTPPHHDEIAAILKAVVS